MPEYDYDVATSYAEEDSDEVLPIVRKLEELKVKVYNREDRAADQWGVNLADHLLQTYFNNVRYVLLFASKHYVAEKRAKVERQAALARGLEQPEEYVLPIRLDDTEIPGLLPTVGHLDLRQHSVEMICQAVVQKLKQHRSAFTAQTPITQETLSALMRERPLGWEYLLYTGVVWQGLRELDEKYRDHFLPYAPRNGIIEHGDGLEAIHDRNVLFVDLIKVAGETFSDDMRKEVFGAHGDPDRIIHFGGVFVRIFDEFLEWARNIRSASYASNATRVASRLQARFADQQLRAMHKAVQELRASADTLVERVTTGEKIDTSIEKIDMKAVRINSKAPLVFKIAPELEREFMAALAQLSP